MEGPEPLVDPVHLDAARPAPAFLMGRKPLERDQWRRLGRGSAQVPGRRQLVDQRLAEEQTGGDDVVHLPEPQQRQVT